MGWQVSNGSASHFASYVEGLTRVIGHADRAAEPPACAALVMAAAKTSIGKALKWAR